MINKTYFDMDLKNGQCYKLTAANGEILIIKYIGSHKGYPEGILSDGTSLNLKTIGAFKTIEEIECLF